MHRDHTNINFFYSTQITTNYDIIHTHVAISHTVMTA